MLVNSIPILLSSIALAFFWFAQEESIKKNFNKTYREFLGFIGKRASKVKIRIAKFYNNRGESEDNGL